MADIDVNPECDRDILPISLRKQRWLKTSASTVLITLAGLATPAYAQFGASPQSDQDLKLAADSPFRDPDIIYLEADILTNDEESQILTAKGQVEGRYQDKTLRADSVIYHLDTGKVIANGNVVLVQADGSSQYADKLELSNELEAGTATDFVARLPDHDLLHAAKTVKSSYTMHITLPVKSAKKNQIQHGD